MEKEASSSSPAVALIVGATGMVGLSLAEALNNPSTPGSPWKVYGVARRPLYPGSRYTWEHFCDMSDSRLLAEQQIWAATTESAKNQAFNCTNGDFFTWKKFWKAFCQVFDVEFDEEEECGFDVVGMMAGMGHVWDEIVEKHGLVRTKMADITCFDAVTVVTNFKFQHVCSMNKSRKFGFLGYCNTLESIPYWVGRMREMKIIP
ncbi:unnamed protein product [Linum tenue]|uniref:Uncharacterized protein n=1 Tax=Linum tenue TaxID=586396 RepID=A0AAV0QYF6_9ROSI|nr:unnamed protein product [Linum tenue]